MRYFALCCSQRPKQWCEGLWALSMADLILRVCISFYGSRAVQGRYRLIDRVGTSTHTDNPCLYMCVCVSSSPLSLPSACVSLSPVSLSFDMCLYLYVSVSLCVDLCAHLCVCDCVLCVCTRHSAHTDAHTVIQGHAASGHVRMCVCRICVLCDRALAMLRPLLPRAACRTHQLFQC